MSEPASGAPIDQHRSVPYVEREHGSPTGFAAAVDPDDGCIEVRGTCPGCGGFTVSPFPRGIPAAGYKGTIFRRKRQRIPAPERATMFCECGHLHDGRPDAAYDVGCGAFWTVDLI